jgi:hypothetical protein
MSGTTISNLPAAGSVSATDLLVKVALGTPNVTQRANPGTTGTEVTTFAQFAPLAAAAGVITLPGGVKIEWGNGTTSASSLTLTTITFSAAFSSTPWVCLAQPFINSGIEFITLCVLLNTLTTTQAAFSGYNTQTGAAFSFEFFWIAIGPT